MYLDCTNGELIANGFCDDETNNVWCNYDGGDCCGLCVATDYCSDCQCSDEYIDNMGSNPLIGNGYCNDGLNTEHCIYDGGDCCGPDVSCK